MCREVEALVAAGDLFETGGGAVSALAETGVGLSSATGPFAPGRHVGPYEIVEAIGAGGMGEVYRGRDTRLHRDVALKVDRNFRKNALEGAPPVLRW